MNALTELLAACEQLQDKVLHVLPEAEAYHYDEVAEFGEAVEKARGCSGHCEDCKLNTSRMQGFIFCEARYGGRVVPPVTGNRLDRSFSKRKNLTYCDCFRLGMRTIVKVRCRFSHRPSF